MPWKTISASVQGAKGAANSIPCQDSHQLKKSPDRLIAVVCDGAGSASFAKEGATIAAKVALEYLETTADPGGGIVTIIQEALKKEAMRRGAKLRDFATTLLCARIDPHESVFMQIGDGAIIGWKEDQSEVLFWPKKYEYANETNFVTDNDAQNFLQIQKSPTFYSEVALITDGLEKLSLQISEQTVFKRFFQPLRQCLIAAKEDELDELSAMLATFLNSANVNQRTDDDKTLILGRYEHC